MNINADKHWSQVEYLSETVTNPNIIISGTKSYYSNAWSGSFEDYCVRYLYGDRFSRKHWQPQWEIDKLYIGNYVCIGAEAVILMGGNNTHRLDWFSDYPFAESIVESYLGRGDTVIGNGAWIGMRAMLMPGISIGEGAVIAAGAVVCKDVEPYQIVGGNPAKIIRDRFPPSVIERLLALHIYEHSEAEIEQIRPLLCSDNIDALENALNILE